MRKLASIQKIAELKQIEGADNIELARVNSWWVVVKKGDFKVDSLCAYFEIDSLLPKTYVFNFMANNGTKKTLINGKEVEGYLVKTRKIMGHFSQGLALPLSCFEEVKGKPVGEDISELIGVVKYDPPEVTLPSGETAGPFPSNIPKTDVERAQNIQNPLSLQGIVFYISEKLDGTSCTVFKDKDGKLHVCSRNLEIKESDNSLYWSAIQPFKETLLSEKFPKEIALQGEIIGPGIQKNPLKLKNKSIFFFNAFDIFSGYHIKFRFFKHIIGEYSLPCVPILAEFYDISPNDLTNWEAFITESAALRRRSVLNPDVMAEGIVVKSMDLDNPFSFKIINNNYLVA